MYPIICFIVNLNSSLTPCPWSVSSSEPTFYPTYVTVAFSVINLIPELSPSPDNLSIGIELDQREIDCTVLCHFLWFRTCQRKMTKKVKLL